MSKQFIIAYLFVLSAKIIVAQPNAKDLPFLSSMSFSTQGQKVEMVYIYERSAKPNGTTILLLHGKNFSNVYWIETIHYLSEKGYDVIAPDQIGFGRSSKPVNYQHTFQQMAVNTKYLIDSLNINELTVLGHSMGGMLATRFALMYPVLCKKLILENPIGLEDWKLNVPYQTIDKEMTIELGKTREVLKDYMVKNYFHNEWKPEYEKLLDESSRFINIEEFTAYAKNMALTSDMIFTQPVCYEFNKLKMPVTLIIGLEDKTAIGKDRALNIQMGNYPELGKKTAAEIPNCKLIELKGIGHIPHIESFKRFCDVLLESLRN